MLHQDQLAPWQTPLPYDFHYSEMWRAKIGAELAGTAWQHWNAVETHDYDLTAHLMVIRRRGVCLVGAPIAAVIPEPPWADYVDAILRDFDWALAQAQENPVYLVLNACRIWAATAERLVLSKREGAQWAQPRLPAPLRRSAQTAAAIYAGEVATDELTPALASGFATWIARQMIGLL